MDVVVPIFTAVNFTILKRWTDELFSVNFNSQISILTKYLGGANRANLSSTIASPLDSSCRNTCANYWRRRRTMDAT